MPPDYGYQLAMQRSVLSSIPTEAKLNSALSTDITLPAQVLDVSSLTPPYVDYDLVVSDYLTGDKKTVLDFLGTDITVRMELSKLKIYKKGMEVPIYLIVEVLKKSKMKFQQ